MVFLYEYVWIDADGNLRGKTKVTDKNAEGNVENLPVWNYDGSSTKQAEGNNSEVLIKPQAIFCDPFHKVEAGSSVEGAFLVMCDTYLPNMDPHPTNSRFSAQQTFEKYGELESRFGIEQEFFVKHRDVDGENAGRVLGFGKDQVLKPAPQGQYYCSVGSNNAFGRDFIMAAFHNCLKAGLNLTGMNAEVAPGQWEFQVCADGIAAADQLYIMRYILGRTGESFGYAVDFHPKPVDSVEWNGSGCHTNFSTKAMREEGGYEVIKTSLDKLSNYQELCMKNYGVDNNKRMTGELETSNFTEFSWGVANRGCSVRVPNSTVEEGKGYFEDRRPASNMDPYIVTAMLLELTSDDAKSSTENFQEESESEEEQESVAEEEAEEEAVSSGILLPETSFTETTESSNIDETVFGEKEIFCDGESCKFNCDEQEKEKCNDPLNQTIRKEENIATLLNKENPFDFLESLPTPTDKQVVTQESTTDSLSCSSDSEKSEDLPDLKGEQITNDYISSPENSDVDSNLDVTARVAPEESAERQLSFAEEETSQEEVGQEELSVDIPEPSIQEDYVPKSPSPIDPFVEEAPVQEVSPVVSEPVQQNKSVEEEKPKSAFSAYSNYFNLINKKN